MPRKSSYDGQDRTISNAAQTLLANIRFANVDNPVKTIVVTSSVPNEGKSTISIELARSIAREGGLVGGNVAINVPVLLVKYKRHEVVVRLGSVFATFIDKYGKLAHYNTPRERKCRGIAPGSRKPQHSNAGLIPLYHRQEPHVHVLAHKY